MKARGKEYEQITSTTTDEQEEVFKSLRVDGRYVIPWGGQRPSLFSALRWALLGRNERGLGRKLKNFFRVNTEVI